LPYRVIKIVGSYLYNALVDYREGG